MSKFEFETFLVFSDPPPLFGTLSQILLFFNYDLPLKATTVCDDPTPVAVLATATTSLTDQTCQPSADASSFALIPHSSSSRNTY